MYNRAQIPSYNATQMQRGIKRRIRVYKREKVAPDAAGLDSSLLTNKRVAGKTRRFYQSDRMATRLFEGTNRKNPISYHQ